MAATKEHQPDLILLDIMMPKLDGIEACKRLKSDPTLPFIPIILVTAKADTKDVVAGLEAGADEYLTKPVDQVGAGGARQGRLAPEAAARPGHRDESQP